MCVFVCVCVLVAQSCPTICDPMDCSLPDFSVHGILQARIVEWIAIPFIFINIGMREREKYSMLDNEKIAVHNREVKQIRLL